MINGNSVILQLGEESTYGTAATATEQVKISSESFKPVYNKVDEGVATGGRGAGKKQTMGIGVEGGFSTLMRPDMGLLLKCLTGKEEAVTTEDEMSVHTFHAIGTALNDSLPSMTIKVNRIAGTFAYSGVKINSVQFSASAGDYLKIDVTANGKNEATTTMESSLTPSSARAFRFAGGKVKIANTEVADITSITLNYNNNLDAQTQTTGTGDYYSEPECGTREITADFEMLYSASAETIRNLYYKTDNTFACELSFNGDNDTQLVIKIPCCQCSDATANMGGLDTLSQSISCAAVDNLSDELVEIKLINDEENLY